MQQLHMHHMNFGSGALQVAVCRLFYPQKLTTSLVRYKDVTHCYGRLGAAERRHAVLREEN